MSKVLHICSKCGKAQRIETPTKDDKVLVEPYTARICKWCDSVGSYPIVLGNLNVVIIGLLNRIKKLEERLDGADD